MSATPKLMPSLAGSSAVVGCGPMVTATDVWLCLLPVSLFLSIMSFV
jgi:hypothetical protein